MGALIPWTRTILLLVGNYTIINFLNTNVFESLIRLKL